MEDELKAKKEKTEEFELVEVPTQTAEMFRDKAGTLLTANQLLVRLANKIESLSKRLG